MKSLLVYEVFLIVILATCIEELNGDCAINIIRSKNQAYGYYYNDQGGYVYGSHYPAESSYAVCSDISLAPNQQLNEMIPTNRIFKADKRVLECPSLRFENSHIPTIYVSLFAKLESITHLYMNGTGLEEIQPGGFNGLSKLKELHMNDNNLTEIHRGTLNYLSTLVTLNMSNNYIRVIENNAFMGLLNLEQLYLSHNELKIISPQTFPYFKFIKILDLSYNNIQNLSENVFNNSLEFTTSIPRRNFELNLMFNNITTISANIFLQTVSTVKLDSNHINKFLYFNSSFLNYLSLNNNSISNITIVDAMLTHLSLSKNNISGLDSNIFKNSSMLVTLDLSNNVIRILHEDIFLNLTSLVNLFLDNNKLDYIPIGCFRNLTLLKSLNISGNEIVEFEYGTFSGLKNLVTLDISNNSLMFLYESTLHPLSALENLYIDHNLITTFDPYDIVQQLQSLRRVSLNYNQWNCKSLLNIFSQLKSRNVVVYEGLEKKVANIHGIACNNNKFDANLAETLTTPIINSDNADSNVLKAFKDFFSEDFFNTAFYKYFSNYSSTQHQEELFLDNFQTAFKNILHDHKSDIINSTFIQQLNETISNFVREFKLLPNKLANTSFQDNVQLKHEISQYFNSDFKNSSFYKYFNKDWNDDSNFAAVFTKLNALKRFFDVEFTNSSFYKFFDNRSAWRNNVEAVNDTPKSEKLTDNTENVVSTITSLQNSINALLVVIIVILFGLLVLFVIKGFKSPIKKLIKGNIKVTSDSQANMELL